MVIDLDRCWGCRTREMACKQELGQGVEACPFGVMEADGEGEAPVKRTLCRDRREGGALSGCAQHCIGRAMTLIDEDRLEEWQRGRYAWKTGRNAYVSGKWTSLGEALKGDGYVA
jgi:Fe-S-cluster-containing dehydrogenase component